MNVQLVRKLDIYGQIWLLNLLPFSRSSLATYIAFIEDTCHTGTEFTRRIKNMVFGYGKLYGKL